MDYIDTIRIKNFKKFRDLKVDNIEQFNLITGDNNVGKSTLLEAIVVIQDNIDTSIEYLHRTLCAKNLHIHPKHINTKSPIIPTESYFDYIKNTSTLPIEFEWKTKERSHSLGFENCVLNDLREVDFNLRKSDNYNVNNTKNWIKIFKDGIYEELQWMYLDDFKRNLYYGYWELITFNAGFSYDINTFYAENIGVDEAKKEGTFTNNQLEIGFKTLNYEEKKAFLKTLTLFVSDIEDTTIKNYYGRDILSIKTKALSDYHPITFWGEGFNKFVRYLLEIVKCNGERILIDEIDTGIHWTKLKNFWKYVLLACQENKVQLFTTSHSQECIKAFIEAGEESHLNDKLRLIELEEFKTKDNKSKITSTTYDLETLKFKIETETNIRGGDVWA